MEPSKVYFTNMRTPLGTGILMKLRNLLEAAGMGEIPMEKKMVAIKIHFGEPGNLAFLRPNYAKVVADMVKEQGGIPFLTDCNTLYPGRRKHAIEHMDAAYENGYSPFSTGCQIIIGDGLKGTDDVEIPVEGGELVQTAKLGRGVMDADVFITLSHFKGHECTGFGGAIKNAGMGCGSRRGKMEMHNGGKPEVDPPKCVGCRQCAHQCGQDAILFNSANQAYIDHDLCVGCGRCLGACNLDAIINRNSMANDDLNRKVSEYAKGAVNGRPQFHISMVIDITPYCDCHVENDTAILPDVGMFASYDMVALDQACADACLSLPPLPNTHLTERMAEKGFRDHQDHFTNSQPETQWRVGLEHAEKIGLGSCSYQLISIDEK